MAKVTLCGTINTQGTREIDRTNLAQLREPAKITGSIAAGLACENWRNSPATIKDHHLVLHDLDHIFDAVDADQSMHLDPPGRDESFMDQHDTSVAAEFKAVRVQKGKLQQLYREMCNALL